SCYTAVLLYPADARIRGFHGTGAQTCAHPISERERITSRRRIQRQRTQPATKLLQAAAVKPTSRADERDRACDEAGCNPAAETARSDEAHNHVHDESEPR